MVNTLFASHLIESKGRLEVDGPMRQTTEIKEEQHGMFFLHFPHCRIQPWQVLMF
jgi:hypothetical protein